MPAVTPPGGGRAPGRRGEELAAQHLRRRGFAILARNVRSGTGEIDLIATDGATIVFAEVKTTGFLRARDSNTDGAASPAAAAACVLERLGARQRRRVRGLALDWLRGQPPTLRTAGELRFDAIGVVLGPAGELLALEHLEGAW
jgi:putative endonuclease